MLSESPYKIGLGPKILNRAKLILGSLLFIFTIVTIAAVYQGVTSGDFDRVLLKPFREFASDFEKATTPKPIPIAIPVATSPTILQSASPSPTTQPVKKYAPVQQSQPVISNCIRRNIREGEFASNKCYSREDYDDLEYYLQRFNSAVFSLEGAEASMRITCSGSDFFKDSCERDKQQKSQAESDISKYRGIIQGIIAKGK